MSLGQLVLVLFKLFFSLTTKPPSNLCAVEFGMSKSSSKGYFITTVLQKEGLKRMVEAPQLKASKEKGAGWVVATMFNLI